MFPRCKNIRGSTLQNTGGISTYVKRSRGTRSPGWERYCPYRNHNTTNTAANSLGCNWLFNGKFDNLSLKKWTSFFFIQVFVFIKMYPVVVCCYSYLVWGFMC